MAAKLSEKAIQKLAKNLDKAAFNAEAISQLSVKNKFSEKEAYAIQKASIEMRHKRGERHIGLKMGFTSKAKMKQMGVNDLIWGRLTNKMLYKDGAKFNLNRHIHPRAEPEICFLIGKKINRKLSLKEAPNFVKYIAPALEIIDSRYKDFKFSLEDVIADNCSSAGLVIGPWRTKDIPLKKLRMFLEIDNRVVQSGMGKDILGDPWNSLVDASRLAKKYGQAIEAGDIILAGAATPAVYLKKGQKVRAIVEQLGSCKFTT